MTLEQGAPAEDLPGLAEGIMRLAPESGELRWHYGPTDKDPDPGSMWCYDYGGEAWFLEDGYICRGCGRQAGA